MAYYDLGFYCIDPDPVAEEGMAALTVDRNSAQMTAGTAIVSVVSFRFWHAGIGKLR